jgi:hypothetical protein
MSSRGQRIRDYLREQDRPCAPGEIAAALGLPVLPVCHTIGNMLRAGMLGRNGAGRAFHYFLVREAKPAEIYTTPEAKKARCAELARLAHKAKGGMSRDEYLALCAAKRAANAGKAVPLRKRDAKPATPRAQRVKPEAKPKAAAKAVRTQAQRMLANEPHQSVRLREAPPVKHVPAETIEQWMARTGQRPQVLPVAWNEARGM